MSSKKLWLLNICINVRTNKNYKLVGRLELVEVFYITLRLMCHETASSTIVETQRTDESWGHCISDL